MEPSESIKPKPTTENVPNMDRIIYQVETKYSAELASLSSELSAITIPETNITVDDPRILSADKSISKIQESLNKIQTNPVIQKLSIEIQANLNRVIAEAVQKKQKLESITSNTQRMSDDAKMTSTDFELEKKEMGKNALQELESFAKILEGMVIPETDLTPNDKRIEKAVAEISSIRSKLSDINRATLTTEDTRARVEHILTILRPKREKLLAIMGTMPKESPLTEVVSQESVPAMSSEDEVKQIVSFSSERLGAITIPGGELVAGDSEVKRIRQELIEIRGNLFYILDLPNPTQQVKNEVERLLKIVRDKGSRLPTTPEVAAPQTEAPTDLERKREEDELIHIEEYISLPLDDLKALLPTIMPGLISLKNSQSPEIVTKANELERTLNEKMKGPPEDIQDPKSPPVFETETVPVTSETPIIEVNRTKEAFAEIDTSRNNIPVELEALEAHYAKYEPMLKSYAGKVGNNEEEMRVQEHAVIVMQELLNKIKNLREDKQDKELEDIKKEALAYAQNGQQIDEVITDSPKEETASAEVILDNEQQPVTLEDLKAGGVIKSNRGNPDALDFTSPIPEFLTTVTPDTKQVPVSTKKLVLRPGIKRKESTIEGGVTDVSHVTIPSQDNQEAPLSPLSDIERKPSYIEKMKKLSGKILEKGKARLEKASLLEKVGKLTKNAFDSWKNFGKDYNELSTKKKVLIGLGLLAGTFAFGAGATLIPVAALRIVSTAGLFVTLDKGLEIGHLEKTGEERSVLRKYIHQASALTFSVLVGSGIAASAIQELFPTESIKEVTNTVKGIIPEGETLEDAVSRISTSIDEYSLPEDITMPAHPVITGDNLTKIIKEGFPDLANLGIDRQEAINLILKQIESDPWAYGVSSGNIDMIYAEKDLIDMQKIGELIKELNLSDSVQAPEGNINPASPTLSEASSSVPSPVSTGTSPFTYSPPLSDSFKELTPEYIAPEVSQRATSSITPGIGSIDSQTATVAGVMIGGAGMLSSTQSPQKPLTLSDTIIQEEDPNTVLQEEKKSFNSQLDTIFGVRNFLGEISTRGEKSPVWINMKGKMIGDLLTQPTPDDVTIRVKNLLGNLALDSGLVVNRGETIETYITRALVKIAEDKTAENNASDIA